MGASIETITRKHGLLISMWGGGERRRRGAMALETMRVSYYIIMNIIDIF